MTSPQPIVVHAPLVGEPLRDSFDDIPTLIYAVYLSNGLVVTRPSGYPDYQAEPTERTVKLSDAALAILLDDRPNSPERVRRVREAALMPAIHRELWAEFDGRLPVRVGN